MLSRKLSQGKNSYPILCYGLIVGNSRVIGSGGALGAVSEWKLKDSIAVHKLIHTVLADEDAAMSKLSILSFHSSYFGLLILFFTAL